MDPSRGPKGFFILLGFLSTLVFACECSQHELYHVGENWINDISIYKEEQYKNYNFVWELKVFGENALLTCVIYLL